jgi:MFS family permease
VSEAKPAGGDASPPSRVESTAGTPVDAPLEPAIRIPFVRAFALGRSCAVLGAQVLSTSVGWELYERTGDPFALGLVGLVQLIPVLALFVAAGNAVDRYPRRRVAMLAHGLHAIAALGLAATATFHAPTSSIYALLAVIGVARAFSAPAIRSLLPQVIAPAQFAHVNAWMSAAWEVASVAGPAVAGWIIAATGGTRVAYLVAAASQVAMIAALRRVPRVAAPVRARRLELHDVLAGFGFVRRSPVFLAAITLDLFAVLLGGAVALLPVFAKDVLHVGPTGLGWLRAAPGAGAMLMALAMTRLRPWTRPGVTLLVAVVGFGLATIGFGLSKSLPLSLACLFLTGVFDAVSVVIRTTLEQMITPDALRGRVAAINLVFIGLSNELGAFESGTTATLFGPYVSVVGGGVGTLVVAGVVAAVWPALARVGPLASLRPSEDEVARAARLAEP